MRVNVGCGSVSHIKTTTTAVRTITVYEYSSTKEFEDNSQNSWGLNKPSPYTSQSGFQAATTFRSAFTPKHGRRSQDPPGPPGPVFGTPLRHSSKTRGNTKVYHGKNRVRWMVHLIDRRRNQPSIYLVEPFPKTKGGVWCVGMACHGTHISLLCRVIDLSKPVQGGMGISCNYTTIYRQTAACLSLTLPRCDTPSYPPIAIT